MMTEINLEIFADYFQFYIQDEQAENDLNEFWTEQAFKILLATAKGKIGIGTVRNMTVPVTIKIHEMETLLLPSDQSIYDQINECDIEISSGTIVIAGCTEYFKEAKRIKIPNGIYRMRVYYGNLDKLSEDGLDGKDFYEIHLWKTNVKSDLIVVKNWSSVR